MSDHSYDNPRRAVTIVLPSGRRTHRSVTLCSETDTESEGSDTETTHLLDGEGNIVRRHCLWTYQFQKLQKIFSTNQVQGVFKCSLAYLIGSLPVYIIWYNIFLLHSALYHLLETFWAKVMESILWRLYTMIGQVFLTIQVAVYFHPFRTIGGMIEANFFALFALAFGLLTGIGSMATTVFFQKLHQRVIGYVLVLIVWTAGSTGTIAYLKQRLSNPSFNTCCSLASIIIFLVIAREGDVQEGEFSTHKIAQITSIVALGTLISNVVCYSLWPVSAIHDVKTFTVTALHSLADSLSLVTSSYLGGRIVDLSTLNSTLAKPQKSIDGLLKTLNEAWWEFLIQGRMNEYKFHRTITQRLQNLSLALNGLRASSSELRKLLLEAEAMKEPLEVFSTFTDYLGPPMKALVYTCRGILREPLYTPAPAFRLLVQSTHRDSLLQALEVYSKARGIALSHLYANNMSGLTVEEIAASMHFFSFSLEEFTKELIGLLETMTELAEFQTNPISSFSLQRNPPQQQFPKLNRRLTNSLPAAIPRSHLSNLKYKTWKFLKRWKTDEMKFAIKVGLGAALAVLPSFITATRSFFRHYRAEWGLLTYMIVCSYSIGATNTAGFYRILGNFLGTGISVIAWVSFPENPWVLAFWGYIMAVSCFQLIIKSKKYTTFGRFILLGYNLTLLYAYSLSQADEDEDDEDEGGQAPFITTIAVHRMVAVIAGVVWGMIICSYIARKKLREELSDLWLKMGWSLELESVEVARDPQLLHPNLTLERIVILQQQLYKISGLVSQTSGETRIAGPFPVMQYTMLLSLCQEMLDSFSQMRVALTETIEADSREWQVLQATVEERKELCNRLLLYFYLLASAVRLKFPLPDRFPLPSAEDARDRLIQKISTLRGTYSNDRDFALLYAYTLVSGQLNSSLDKSFEIVGKLFGKIELEV